MKIVKLNTSFINFGAPVSKKKKPHEFPKCIINKAQNGTDIDIANSGGNPLKLFEYFNNNNLISVCLNLLFSIP